MNIDQNTSHHTIPHEGDKCHAAKKMMPSVRIELTTPSLRDWCSATELWRPWCDNGIRKHSNAKIYNTWMKRKKLSCKTTKCHVASQTLQNVSCIRRQETFRSVYNARVCGWMGIESVEWTECELREEATFSVSPPLHRQFSRNLSRGRERASIYRSIYLLSSVSTSERLNRRTILWS